MNRSNVYKSFQINHLLHIMDEVNLPLAGGVVQVVDERLVKNDDLQQILIVYSITLSHTRFDRLEVSPRHSEEVDEFLVLFIDYHVLKGYRFFAFARLEVYNCYLICKFPLLC